MVGHGQKASMRQTYDDGWRRRRQDLGVVKKAVGKWMTRNEGVEECRVNDGVRIDPAVAERIAALVQDAPDH